jgi:O-antigen/teichoic acid export membrane protein
MDAPSTTPRRPFPRRLLALLEINRAVFYSILLRLWQLLAGAGTIVLMTQFFSKETQGYYYTFASLVALQTFFELGLNIVVINICSHEWAQLELDETGAIRGDAGSRSRLVSLGRMLFRWYGVASILFTVVAGSVGVYFLNEQPDVGVQWHSPWLVLAIVSGLLLWTLPFNAMLEGCDQVTTVNRFRLIQAIMANVSVWTVMIIGGGLWAAVAATSARLVCDLYLLLVRYRHFFAPFFKSPGEHLISWKDEVWPLQWRLAVGGVFSYFAFFLLTPVMISYHGAVVAGQMGMTWTVVTAIQAAAIAWVQTRVPRFGMLVKEHDFSELDRVFRRVTLFGAVAMILAGGTFWLLLYGLNSLEFRVAGRLLAPLPTGLLLLAALVQMLANSLVFYVRAHKQEPFLVISVISNCLIGLMIWRLGSWYGPTGAAIGLLAENAMFTLPAHWMIWMQCRRHQN